MPKSNIQDRTDAVAAAEHPAAGGVPVLAMAEAVAAIEGDNWPIRRAFPRHNLPHFDPFLLFDHFGPVDIHPGSGGLPAHPHRGFETITYMLEGAMEHRDSQGGHALIGAGDVQWMTAGAGIVHSEMPPDGLRKNGGRVEGFQIWVNLPRAQKFAKPGYQYFAAKEIPVLDSADGRVRRRIIAGEAEDENGRVHRGAVATRFAVMLCHDTLAAGAKTSHIVPAGHTVFVYVIRGSGKFGPEGQAAHRGQFVVFADRAGAVEFAADKDGLDALILSGKRLDEPIFGYGPFVMNSRDEIVQAIEDYHAGRMGHLDD